MIRIAEKGDCPISVAVAFHGQELPPGNSVKPYINV
jgi:hypothetical protein